jgi:hypothetical protein
MDPITTAIVGAVAAGALAGATDASQQAIVAAYTALKEHLARAFGPQSPITTAIEEVEQAPDQDYPRQMLARRVTEAGAADNPELVAAANRVLALVQQTIENGDTIHAPHAQGFINRPTGSVSQHFGDTVQGNKTSGDIHTGAISGQGVAVGHGAQATWSQQRGLAGDEVARLFQPIYQQIQARQSSEATKTLLAEQVQQLEGETRKGEQANEQVVRDRLTVLAEMAPDVLEVVASALVSPAAGVASLIKKVAAGVRKRQA